MNQPQFPELKPVGLEDRDLVESLIANHPSEVCELHFGNIFLWRHYEQPRLTFIHSNLCFLCAPPSEPPFFLPPIGELRIEETIATCLTLAPRISRVPEEFVLKFGGRFKCQPDPDNFDYVYRSEDLILLRGKKYDGKRNRIHKFEKTHRFRYLRLSPERRAECLELLSKWIREKAETNGKITEVWQKVIEGALEYSSPLGLRGGGIEIDGRIAGFSIGSRLNADTAVIHVEVTDPEIDGLSQLMNREFCKHEWSGFRFINREQDNGDPGLRRAKLSYHPHHMVKKYNIWGS